MGYFSENASEIDLDHFEENLGGGIRRCQAGGFWGVKSHFSAYPDDPALVSMPTGTGKTALMMLLAFGLSERQVLVVTASDVLRSQTARKFEQLDGLRDTEVVDDGLEGPSVAKLTSRVTSEEVWDDLNEDVVIALPQNISTVYDSDQYDDSIVSPPSDKFDLVFFDEAHHVRAPSWMDLLRAFDSSKRVLLTATPFRRDRRTLPGKLVYHYPLDNAMEDGLYQPLSLRDVSTRNVAEPDETLVEAAEEELGSLRTNYEAAKLLIRCNRIERASELKGIYANEGVEVEAIHSERTSVQNSATLKSLQDGDLDGVIAVGMLGEGIDMADLKIAVLHQPPKSFAFTLQLIGRVTRPAEADIQAKVIADSDRLREAGVDDIVRRLYHEDKGWRQLIPNLVDEYIQSTVTSSSGETALRGVNEHDIEPYLSTRLYDVDVSEFDFTEDISLGEDIIVYRLPRSDDVFLGLITEQPEKPSWGTKTPLGSMEYGLHLYYYHDQTETLFESSTSDELAEQIREQVISTKPTLFGGEKLVRVLQGEQDIEYQVAGLASALGPTRSIPSYKMYLGDRVEGAVRQTDAQAFAQGHAVAKVDGTIVGISNEQGRVWSSGREKIDDFIDWCRGIAQKLTQYQRDTAAPKLGLGEVNRITEFPEEPIYATLNPDLRRVDVTMNTGDGRWLQLENLQLMELDLLSETPESIEFSYEPRDDSASINGEYSVNENIVSGELGECQFTVDSGEEIVELSAETFFSRYPLYFCLGDGTLVYNGRGHQVKNEYSGIPDRCFLSEGEINWSRCATWHEYSIDPDDEDANGLIHVHEWVEEFTESTGEGQQIVFRDHTQGEIADYVQFEPGEGRISFYHCKSRPKDSDSGARLDDVRDVVDQVFRSINWIRDSGLPARIRHRQENTTVEGFVLNEEGFEEIEAGFQPNAWDYRVYIVQPGLDHTRARSSENINTLLVTCREWLRAADAELRIIGDPDNQIVAIN